MWAEGVTAIESREIVIITNIILDIVLLNLRAPFSTQERVKLE